MKKTLLNLTIALTTIVALVTLTQLKEDVKSYSVRKIKGTLDLSGKGDDPTWKKANVLSDFHYPWEKEKAPPTKFKALHNDEWVYFLFDVTDPSVYIHVEGNDKSEVASSSRAEIFFRADDQLNPYYCLEIDPLGRVLDYEATYHRKFNSAWYWPKDHLSVKTDKGSDGYSVEFAISKSSLQQLGLLKHNILQAGLFRANCKKLPGGDIEFKWISWLKPASETADFHIPSSFGFLQLEK